MFVEVQSPEFDFTFKKIDRQLANSWHGDNLPSDREFGVQRRKVSPKSIQGQTRVELINLESVDLGGLETDNSICMFMKLLESPR
jgi:hypothetical protein